MRALALVASARRRGNCHDMARFVLDRLAAAGVETELVNFCEQRITPCQRCAYECLQRRGPQRDANAPCPIDDDVRSIWEKTWAADLLFLFVPNYGGMPPALWLAFSQRYQAFFREAPAERLKRRVLAAVVLAAPQYASGAQWTPSIIADEVKHLGGHVAGFELINTAGFETGDSRGGLIDEPEIRRRLQFLADRAMQAAAKSLAT